MIADEIFAIYSGRGAGDYFGEAVSVAEHSLQAAHFAQSCEAPDSLVIAALLHDIGHLIEPAPADIADWKTDAGHERTGNGDNAPASNRSSSSASICPISSGPTSDKSKAV